MYSPTLDAVFLVLWKFSDLSSFCLLLTGVLGTHHGTLSEQEGNDLTPASRKDAELYISGKPALPSPMRLWDLEGWGLGRGPNQNMFCLALCMIGQALPSPPLGLCILLLSPFPDSVTGCEVAYPSSETEPHTAEISYT